MNNTNKERSLFLLLVLVVEGEEDVEEEVWLLKSVLRTKFLTES
jgi:hypothetical protein